MRCLPTLAPFSEGQLERDKGSSSLLQPVIQFTYFGNLPLSGPPLSHFCNGNYTPDRLILPHFGVI